MIRPYTRLLSLVLAAIMAGCTTAQPSPQVSSTVGSSSATPALTPYHSATPRPQRSQAPASTSTPLPTMTPTPLSYKVVKGDDMFGIALRHGITLPVLLTANPTVNPSFLSVGTILQIPQAQATPKPGESTPVPVPVDLGTPVCYPSAEGGLWCLVEAHNPDDQAIENLRISVAVSDVERGSLSQVDAYPLLNLLPAGASLVVGAYFPPPAPLATAGSVSVEAAFYQPEDDVRYPAIQIESQDTSVQPGGLAARVTGRLTLDVDSPAAGEIWLAASAYDDQGQPVGLRRWETSGEFAAGSFIDFDLMIYSLGPEIARVDLLAEAHASLTSPSGTTTPTP